MVVSPSYIEQKLSEAIRQEVGKDVAVEVFPNDPSQYNMTKEKGVILVRYDGAQYGVITLDNAVQDKRIRMEVVVVARGLRSHLGVYPLLEASERAVFRFADEAIIGRSRLVSSDMLGEVKGVWQYGIKLEMDTLYYVEQDKATPLTAITHEITP